MATGARTIRNGSTEGPTKNTKEGKVTALLIVKALLFMVAWYLLIRVVFFAPLLTRGFTKGLGIGIVGVLMAIGLTYVFLKIDHARFAAINLQWQRGTPLRFLLGLIIGTVVFTLMILALLHFAGMELQRSGRPLKPTVLLFYLGFFPLAYMEELAFRAYAFKRFQQVGGLRLAQWIIATCFALYHITNANNLLAAFAGPFVWSFVFGLAAARSGGLEASRSANSFAPQGRKVTLLRFGCNRSG